MPRQAGVVVADWLGDRGVYGVGLGGGQVALAKTVKCVSRRGGPDVMVILDDRQEAGVIAPLAVDCCPAAESVACVADGGAKLEALSVTMVAPADASTMKVGGVRAGLGLEIFKERGSGNVERFGNVEESFIEEPALASFDLDEHVSCDAGGECNLFLRQSPFLAQCADPAADGVACRRPSNCAVGIVWAGTSRHAP